MSLKVIVAVTVIVSRVDVGPVAMPVVLKANVVSKRFARVLSKGNVESAATNKRRGEEQSHRHISGFRH